MESKTTSRWGGAALTSKTVHAATAHVGKQESAETTGVRRLRPAALTRVKRFTLVVLVSQFSALN